VPDDKKNVPPPVASGDAKAVKCPSCGHPCRLREDEFVVACEVCGSRVRVAAPRFER
jgi:hypothetical protein